MPVGRAELVLDHGAALEVVADARLHRDLEPAVGRDRVLADGLDAAADLGLDLADRSLALFGRQIEQAPMLLAAPPNC
ncbi:MAG: hypothetical protein ACKOPM_11055 [Novosphingobium sp.]